MERWRTLLTVGAIVLLAARAHGQGGVSGSISGNVTDESGNPIRGVKIVAASPTQIGGAKTTYTNGEGFFRFVQLQPGTFEVRASSQNLHTYVENDIKVGITA